MSNPSRRVRYFSSKYLVDRNYLVDNALGEKYELHEKLIQGLMSDFDYIELNMINFYYDDVMKALLFAEKYDKPVLVGGDIHHANQVDSQGYNLIKKGMTLYEALRSDNVIPVINLYSNLSFGILPSWSVIKYRGLSSKFKNARK